MQTTCFITPPVVLVFLQHTPTSSLLPVLSIHYDRLCLFFIPPIYCRQADIKRKIHSTSVLNLSLTNSLFHASLPCRQFILLLQLLRTSSSSGDILTSSLAKYHPGAKRCSDISSNLPSYSVRCSWKVCS